MQLIDQPPVEDRPCDLPADHLAYSHSIEARIKRLARHLPGRNDPCWCGSGHKYKKCCGPVPAAADDAS